MDKAKNFFTLCTYFIYFTQAPRAKMNQQRSRRFRASKETSEKITEIARIRSELASKGSLLPPEKPKEDHFDSNCITPVNTIHIIILFLLS